MAQRSTTDPEDILHITGMQGYLPTIEMWHQQQREVSLAEFYAAMNFCCYDSKLSIRDSFQSETGINDNLLEQWAESKDAPNSDGARKYYLKTLTELMSVQIDKHKKD